jgi:pyruvate formate lyase activating enzyme
MTFMKIVGIQKNSFVDYPGKVAAVIFTRGCNMDCYFCHNRHLLTEYGEDQYDSNEILRFLKDRKKFLDAVVISGGEPTLQPGLAEYIRKIKALGFLVKLDTNGTRPDVLTELINEGIIDYAAMDLKAPFERYEEICGTAVDIKSIQESVSILMLGRIEYEFRTTVVPELKEEDIIKIAERIQGARLYILQQFRQPELSGGPVDYRLLKPPHNPSFIRALSEKTAVMVSARQTRGIG